MVEGHHMVRRQFDTQPSFQYQRVGHSDTFLCDKELFTRRLTEFHFYQ